MKRTLLLSLVLMLTCAFAHSTAQIKQVALKTAQTMIQTPFFNADGRFFGKDEGANRCALSKNQLYAGRPFLVRTLIHPTRRDLERLRTRVARAMKEPGFIGDPKGEVEAAKLNRDFYEVPIYDRVCGYLFHIRSRTGLYAPSVAGEFKPISAKTAQRLLGTKQPPVFIAFYESLTPENDGYLWVSDAKAVEAFDEHAVYQIVDRSGKPVSPLEARLKTQIFRESFVTSMGEPSAYWHFRLPVRLEPLSLKP